MKTDKKSLAFTLAEALLTLTIIGVLMALMMRSINRVSPDKEKILFLKTYHAIEHAVVNAINDPSRYDPNYYSDSEISEMKPAEIADLHRDFRDTPMKDAKVHINGKEITSCNADSPSTPCINHDNAMCYFLADSLNTVGEVNCESNTDTTVNGNTVKGYNFRTSNGSCLGYLVGVETDGSNTPTIDPVCGGDFVQLTIFNDGKMTVKEKLNDGTANAYQAKAYKWMFDQTQVK